jgi:uncharacterized protein (DUF2236 family)
LPAEGRPSAGNIDAPHFLANPWALPATDASMSALDHLARPAKRLIAGQIEALFNDRSRGERPVARSDEGWFEPDSTIRKVHGDVTSMMIGGLAALLLQMLHPAVLAGVWDHSRFREDRLGRLRRTARFIAVTTYGARAEAEEAIARVRAIHMSIGGQLPDGTSYRADDPQLLAWVHVTEATCFLNAWRRYGDPAMPLREQDRYFAQIARIGEALGAEPVPQNSRDAARLIADMRQDLRADDRSREVASIILQPPRWSDPTSPWQALTAQAAIDLLPRWARDMHGLSSPLPARPLVRTGAFAMAQTVRWAFSQDRKSAENQSRGNSTAPDR